MFLIVKQMESAGMESLLWGWTITNTKLFPHTLKILSSLKYQLCFFLIHGFGTRQYRQ